MGWQAASSLHRSDHLSLQSLHTFLKRSRSVVRRLACLWHLFTEAWTMSMQC